MLQEFSNIAIISIFSSSSGSGNSLKERKFI